MSYKALINTNLTRAFNLIKDLATSHEFVKRTGSAFNFATASAEHATTNTVTAKIVVMDDKKQTKDRGSVTKHFMARKSELGDVSIYDTVTIEGEIWKVGPLLQDTGFIIMASLHRETK